MIAEKQPWGDYARRYALLIAVAALFILPLLFMVMSSFKSDEQIFSDLRSFRAFLPVGTLSLENYAAVFSQTKILSYFFNSVLITVLTVGGGVLINSMAAFVLARMDFRGKRLMLTAIIALVSVPIEAIVVPLFLLVSRLPGLAFGDGGIILTGSWLDTHHVQIIPFLAHAFSIYLFYQFFIDIPKDFDEAAYIDGATPFQVYRYIIMPMSGPVIGTVVILQSLAMWNQYLWPIIAVQSEGARPIMPGIQQFFGRNVAWGEIMAYATIVTLPILALFVAFQRQFVQSVAGAGVKG
ncbi:MAG: carbohydrate ABC transporter permease [Pseudomonadota bacterium]